jgi:hypothetical protein
MSTPGFLRVMVVVSVLLGYDFFSSEMWMSSFMVLQICYGLIDVGSPFTNTILTNLTKLQE